MRTNNLINALASDLSPVRRGEVPRILALGLACGAVVSWLIMVVWLGLRPDLGAAMATASLWMKFTYTLALGACGFWIVERQARAGAGAARPLSLLLIVLLALSALALFELSAPHADRATLLMGGSAQVCARNIVIVSLPIFIGLFWSLRRLAPTRLVLAGASAGLLAGAAGAWIYAFHCTETAATFTATWYTLGIALMGGLGAVLGRWGLRW